MANNFEKKDTEFSINRFLYIIIAVIIFGVVFAVYNLSDAKLMNPNSSAHAAQSREFTETQTINNGDKPRIWLLDDFEDGSRDTTFYNIRRYCDDIHLSVVEGERLDADGIDENGVVVFCDNDIEHLTDVDALKQVLQGGAKVMFAAGLSAKSEFANSVDRKKLYSMLGITDKRSQIECNELVFENPIFPVQPDEARFNGNSYSVYLETEKATTTFIRDAESDVPLLYTYDWTDGDGEIGDDQKTATNRESSDGRKADAKTGCVCVINGTFLQDATNIGLFAGALGALQTDIIYPVLGLKTVFLDNYPTATNYDDEAFKKVYGYSAEGFLRDQIWSAFQGMSLRSDTPLTAGITVTPLESERSEELDDLLLGNVGKSVIRYNGELIYAIDVNESTGNRVVFDQSTLDRFAETFPDYVVTGLAMDPPNIPSESLQIPSSDIHFIRGSIDDIATGFSQSNGYTVYPAATEGVSMEDGDLFSIYSVLCAYGMISHVFDINSLIDVDVEGDSAKGNWDVNKKQLGIFESDALGAASWLEGTTLSQTEDEVRSFKDLNFGYAFEGDIVHLKCSSVYVGQPFFFRTEKAIDQAQGVQFSYIGDDFYLLRVLQNDATITLKERG